VHGGPNASVSNALDVEKQFWTTRGFAIVDVNYGGSTGFGREYRERLKGQWGIVDVEDCVNASRFLADQKLIDRRRVVITGGSAGGYTTLRAISSTDFFAAGASLYGVSDLDALARETHKFESRYLDGLVAPYPAQAKVYRERSPIHSIDRLQSPAILFQGLEDAVVPPNQATMIVEALKGKGLRVAYLAFEGEQHGFRKASTIKRVLDAELYFYSRIFDFELPDPVEPVTIYNLK
jgi:dipeptidyl aminopeptidase/acylaminoacyl peptidase